MLPQAKEWFTTKKIKKNLFRVLTWTKKSEELSDKNYDTQKFFSNFKLSQETSFNVKKWL